MPFFVKTEIIKKEYLNNSDLKRKVINEHNDWIKKLKKKVYLNCIEKEQAIILNHLSVEGSSDNEQLIKERKMKIR